MTADSHCTPMQRHSDGSQWENFAREGSLYFSFRFSFFFFVRSSLQIQQTHFRGGKACYCVTIIRSSLRSGFDRTRASFEKRSLKHREWYRPNFPFSFVRRARVQPIGARPLRSPRPIVRPRFARTFPPHSNVPRRIGAARRIASVSVSVTSFSNANGGRPRCFVRCFRRIIRFPSATLTVSVFDERGVTIGSTIGAFAFAKRLQSLW